MDMNRAFLAIIISFFILFGYQKLFVPPVQAPVATQGEQQGTAPASPGAADQTPATGTASAPQQSQLTTVPAAVQPAAPQNVTVDENARDITVDTPRYRAVFFEQGGGLKSFILKKYRVAKEMGAKSMELVTTENPAALPLVFSLDNGGTAALPLFKADRESLSIDAEGAGELQMSATLDNGVVIKRVLSFSGDSYLFTSNYEVQNPGSIPLQLTPAMAMSNRAFVSESTTSRYLFNGPAAFVNQELEEVKIKKLSDGPKVYPGTVSWAAFEDNYFMCSLIPEQGSATMVTMASAGADSVRTVVAGPALTLAGGETKVFKYNAYFGPKKLAMLKSTGHQLDMAVHFGWFDFLAKPMLFLLNFFYTYIGNYGIAVILLTCLIKGVFWPITQKGMKSMKNMQKLQPKVAKLKEKFKDDPAKMNQEMMAMYKTYKVNPVGGCLPMVIQIPFFFALYRVLMAAIELRHAPFMLWINDLSAPDRLMIGIDIPYLGGIPILTLLMGGSMFLQQKMTPTTADPTQAKIMQFLPIMFTVMFVNFASGLVLYWFVNNLLSILQQQLINRQLNKESQLNKEELTEKP